MRLMRDTDTGKSRGFGWLKYEDQRSTVLAVDNLNGAKVLGRIIRVDHAVYEERDRDEEYEMMLEQEFKNDFAEKDESVQKEAPSNNQDDEFKDPLLLMNDSSSNPNERRARHKSQRLRDERDRDQDRTEHRRSRRDDDESHRTHDYKKRQRSHRVHDSDRYHEHRNRGSTSHRDREERESTSKETE